MYFEISFCFLVIFKMHFFFFYRILSTFAATLLMRLETMLSVLRTMVKVRFFLFIYESKLQSCVNSVAEGSEWSTLLPCRFKPWKNAGSRWVCGYVGPRPGVDVFWRRGNFCPFLDSNPIIIFWPFLVHFRLQLTRHSDESLSYSSKLIDQTKESFMFVPSINDDAPGASLDSAVHTYTHTHTHTHTHRVPL